MAKYSQEITNYPQEPNILYKEEKHNFHYTIFQEGVYPPDSNIKYTSGHRYKIPDKYEVQTTWGKGENQKTVKCKIDYINNIPIFYVYFGQNFENQVRSDKSASNAATLLHEISKNKAILLLINVINVEINVNNNYILNKHTRSALKPVNEASNSTLTKRAKNLSTQIQNYFQDQSKNYYNQNDILNLKSLKFSTNTKSYEIYFRNQDKENKKQKVQAIVQATDQSLISREAYRSLATIEHKLPHEYLISSEKIQINKEMEVVIPIKLINMQTTRVGIGFYEEPHIIDEEIVNQMVSAIGKAGCRSIKDILKYIVPKLNNDGVLNATCPIINLRISGDGRNVGRKVKQVMVTCAILDDRKNLHFPDKHFTTVLYPGNEDYDSLKNAMALFLKELHELKEFGLEINDIIWQFNFYFSSDWKFLCICLGFNGANSKHFCPWCETSKDERGRLETNWKMTKTMEQLNFDYTVYKGHQQVPLFNMIPLDHWLIDELHVMLRITDHLWNLMLNELREMDLFDDLARGVIVKEMDHIKVKFQFWKEKGKGSESWNYTSLMGEDKMKVLKEFNLGLLFSPSRAIKIRELWNKFSDLYNDLHNDNTNPDDFEKSAKEWLALFLLPSKGNWIVGEEIISGLYLPSFFLCRGGEKEPPTCIIFLS
ncbi:hypothetical protein GLOIN_2v1478248 [Rhizophagus clarus]|uniref:Uncharacterized protein n=1 Tax=Rhizophagus clarus TaxID=94130 RepID=A0A8H3LPB9_9GLOM|nr:hypothetical protein GLOIN_2v1478248 [Rhizophagus clarus]